MMKLLSRIWRHRLIRGPLRRLIPQAARNYYRAYRQGYLYHEKIRFVIYTGTYPAARTILKSDPATPTEIAQPAKHGNVSQPVSLVATVSLPTPDMRIWFDALCRQTRLPDEVVLADRGLNEENKALFQTLEETIPFPIRVVDAAGKSAAEAQNLAFRKAAFSLIACTTMDCLPESDWLESLLSPLESDPAVQLSAGFSTGLPGNEFQNLSACLRTPHIIYSNPAAFEPTLHSVALHKEVWRRTDGFPEWLGKASPDSLFFYQAREFLGVLAVLPDARVKVRLPDDFTALFRSSYQAGLSDGVTGIHAGQYWRNTLNLVRFVFLPGFVWLVLVLFAFISASWIGWLVFASAPVILVLAGLASIFHLKRAYSLQGIQPVMLLVMRLTSGLARLSGFVAGVRLRPAAEARRLSRYRDQLQRILAQHPQRKGIVIYPPTHDWGYMFQLPQQMAHQLARRGYLYFYGTANEKTDSVTGFRQVEPNLYVWHVPFETFRICEHPALDHPQPMEKLVLYLGSPWNRKYLDILTDPLVVYDHYDDLAVSSGRVEDHQSLLKKADIVLVTSQRLLDNVKGTRPDAIFAPNGVDYEHFQTLCPTPDESAPNDLQPVLARHKPIVGYTGALSERFDYDLYRYLVAARPEYEFVLVGAKIDDSLERSKVLTAGFPNLYWLGMKSHAELVKYIWQFAVGIVPFKINEITLATTSIKVFEYMACRVPVVSVDMPESRRYSGVFIAKTYEQFLGFLDEAIEKKQDQQYLALIDQVARLNTWSQRADTLLERL